MMMQFLADAAAAPDFQVSGNWLIAVLVATIPVIGAVWLKGKHTGLTEATNNVTIQAPVPIVPTSKVYSPPSFSQHMDAVRRIEKLELAHESLRKEVGMQFMKLIEVGEERKDKLIEKIESSAKGFHERVNQLVNEMNRNKGK